MTEEFLHYLWRFLYFDLRDLRTTNGEPLVVHKQGLLNTDAGPDFTDARITIGGQLWAGNVEIHVLDKDWYKHGHQTDKAYDNVILHVVYEHSEQVRDSNQRLIPTLVLKDRFDELLYWRYEQLMNRPDPIPCATDFPRVDTLIVESMMDRVLVERLERKTSTIKDLWLRNNKDWAESFYQWIAYGFGLRINAEPMLMLARELPSRILGRHRDRPFQLEAILFGVSGLLDGQDDYARELGKEFNFLKDKYELQPLEAKVWKHSRLRPAAFPEIRLAQLAGLIMRCENLFATILGTGSLKALEHLLSNPTSAYWKEHYRFGVPSKRRTAVAGCAFQQILIINVIVPFLFVYGQERDESFYRQRALDLLDQMDAEDNKVTRRFEQLGLKMPSAYQTQAALQLDSAYCGRKKCLNCAIGTHLIRSS